MTGATYMQRAIELARSAAGGVSPRPPVGAVIVKDGIIVAVGATQPRPGPHAEATALAAAGAAARGATMYVILEPHAHQGVAPPCTDAIIAAGIAKVICLIEDPNPAVSGNGFRQLRSAGIEVHTGGPPGEVEAAENLVAPFAKWVQTRRPLVTAKFAMSIDGKIATATGESRWITGEAARAAAHRMRAESDAVLAGIGTVIRDDPMLTARGEGLPAGRPRLRVVVDTRGRMPPSARLLTGPGRVLWARGPGGPVYRPEAHHRAQVETAELPLMGGRVDLDALVALLGRKEVCSVLAEGGGELLGSLFDGALVDRVAAFIAPAIIGGGTAPGPIAGRGASSIQDALRLENVRHTLYPPDILITGAVAAPERVS